MTTEDAGVIEEAFRSRLATTDPPGSNPINPTQEDEGTTRSADRTESIEASPPVVRTSESGRASAEMDRCTEPRSQTRTDETVGRSDTEDSSMEILDGGPSLPDGAADRPVIDKSVLTFNEPRRYRNRAHLEFVASQPCLICERRPSDAHHVRFAQPSALGRRVSDEYRSRSAAFIIAPCIDAETKPNGGLEITSIRSALRKNFGR